MVQTVHKSFWALMLQVTDTNDSNYKKTLFYIPMIPVVFLENNNAMFIETDQT
jgi:hypothetical protein